MRRYLQVFLVIAAVLAAIPVFGQQVPEIPYDSVPNFLKMPDGLYMGEAAGVAQDSKGNVFVFTRSGETRLFEFDHDGKYLREIAPKLYAFAFAHAVRIDPQDNIWVVDEGSNMIVKFNPQGKVIMTMGRKPESAEGDVPGGFAYRPPVPNAPPPVASLARLTAKPTSPGMPPETSLSPTGTATLASRSTTRTAASSSPSAAGETRPANSIRRTPSPPINKGMSTSATVATTASRSSTMI